MDIRITQRFGQIGIKYIQPQMEIATKPADMRITQIPAELQLAIDYPQINIDMTEMRADIGYKEILPFAREYAGAGQATVLAGIERIAVEGDTLARSAGKGREIIGNIAWNNWFDNVEFNVGAVPQAPPEIWFTGGTKIDVQAGKVQIDIQPNLPEINGTPGSVDIYLERVPMIKVEAVGSYLDLVI